MLIVCGTLSFNCTINSRKAPLTPYPTGSMTIAPNPPWPQVIRPNAWSYQNTVPTSESTQNRCRTNSIVTMASALRPLMGRIVIPTRAATFQTTGGRQRHRPDSRPTITTGEEPPLVRPLNGP